MTVDKIRSDEMIQRSVKERWFISMKAASFFFSSLFLLLLSNAHSLHRHASKEDFERFPPSSVRPKVFVNQQHKTTEKEERHKLYFDLSLDVDVVIMADERSR